MLDRLELLGIGVWVFIWMVFQCQLTIRFHNLRRTATRIRKRKQRRCKQHVALDGSPELSFHSALRSCFKKRESKCMEREEGGIPGISVDVQDGIVAHFLHLIDETVLVRAVAAFARSGVMAVVHGWLATWRTHTGPSPPSTTLVGSVSPLAPSPRASKPTHSLCIHFFVFVFFHVTRRSRI